MRRSTIVLSLVLLTAFLGSSFARAADKEELTLPAGSQRTIAYAGDTTYYRIHNNGPGTLVIIPAPLQGASGPSVSLKPGESVDIAKPSEGKLSLRASGTTVTAWYAFLGV
jgi:hypothetical protein